MRLTYDQVADAAHLYLVDRIEQGMVSRGDILETDVEGAAVLVDYDIRGHILRFEFLGASKILPAEVLSGAIGERSAHQDDRPPRT